MKFREFGNSNNPKFILLHGGGLSWWSLKAIIEDLEKQYHVITPIIDGHGEDGETLFISIEDSANKLISYIDDNYNGKVFALRGLSIGAQIVTEMLSIRVNISEYAIIESALVYPIKGTKALTVPTIKLSYGLSEKRWFSKMQAKSFGIPNNMFEQYYNDIVKMSKESLINITVSNGTYYLKENIHNTNTKVLIIVGKKELSIMKKSAIKLNDMIINSELYIGEGMRHGEISLVHTKKYLKLIKSFVMS